MFLCPFGLYCSACFGSLSVSILCTRCSVVLFYFFYYVLCSRFLSNTLILSLSSFVIPSKCLKNLICAASRRCSSLLFGTQTSLSNFNGDLAVML